MVGIKVITGVATEPVTLAEAKLHLKLDDIAGSHPDDTLVTALITASREACEHYAGLALAGRTLEVSLDEFPECEEDVITLPMGPVASITSVKYTDDAGDEQTVSSSAYALSPYGGSRRLAPTFGNYWPDAQDIPDAVRIRYVTGYAATGAAAGYTTAPKAAVQAILVLIGHLYENRNADVKTAVEDLPPAVRALLNTIKVWDRA